MMKSFCISAVAKPDRFVDNVSKGDAITYEVDFTAWQEDNSTITSVTWTSEYGSAAISGQSLTAGVATALVTFNEQGRSLISVTANTATEKKKIWLELVAKDPAMYTDDYGYGA